MLQRLVLYVGLVAIGACGDDPPPARPRQATPAGGASAPAAAPPAIAVVGKVETLVNCPPPPATTKCDPNAPKALDLGKGSKNDAACPADQYCLPTSAGYFCGPCEDRDRLRHSFRDRDFAPENNRDPFESRVVKATDLGTPDQPKERTSRCTRSEQMRVTRFSYQDLRLVGIISQGTRRKVLMIDPSNEGHTINPGDCVGKEKAWVKEISPTFVCFEPQDQKSSQPAPQVCVELYPKQFAMTQPLEVAPTAPTAPVVAPPPPSSGRQPPATQPPAQPPAQPGPTITVSPPITIPAPPAQPPTQPQAPLAPAQVTP